MAEGQGRSSEQGVKLLYIRDYLHKYTNKEHPKSAKDIIEYLASKGIKAERKTIYNDILRLQMDFQEPIEYNPKKWGYYITEPEFDTRDLRILMDCIQYADFITMEESSRLIGKIKELGNIYDKELFDRPMDAAVKDTKTQDSVFRKIEILSQAIREKKKIRFQFLDYVANHSNNTKINPSVCIVSPHKISWLKDTHILSFSVNYEDRDMTYDPHGFGFRGKEQIYTYCDITRMCNISILATNSIYSKADEQDSLKELEEEYDKLYGPKRAVTVRFNNYYLGDVINKLGNDAILIPIDDISFKTTIMTREDPDFFHWIFSLGLFAEIISPPDVIMSYKNTLWMRTESIMNMYNGELYMGDNSRWFKLKL